MLSSPLGRVTVRGADQPAHELEQVLLRVVVAPAGKLVGVAPSDRAGTVGERPGVHQERGQGGPGEVQRGALAVAVRFPERQLVDDPERLSVIGVAVGQFLAFADRGEHLGAVAVGCVWPAGRQLPERHLGDVPEGRPPEVVRDAGRIDHAGIQSATVLFDHSVELAVVVHFVEQLLGQSLSDLRHFQGMGHAVVEQRGLVDSDHLGHST